MSTVEKEEETYRTTNLCSANNTNNVTRLSRGTLFLYTGCPFNHYIM